MIFKMTVLVGTLAIILALRMHNRGLVQRGEYPFIAITSKGLVVSRTGRFFRMRILSWDVIQISLVHTKHDWQFAAATTAALGVSLSRLEDFMELRKCILDRIERTKLG